VRGDVREVRGGQGRRWCKHCPTLRIPPGGTLVGRYLLMVAYRRAQHFTPSGTLPPLPPRRRTDRPEVDGRDRAHAARRAAPLQRTAFRRTRHIRPAVDRTASRTGTRENRPQGGLSGITGPGRVRVDRLRARAGSGAERTRPVGRTL